MLNTNISGVEFRNPLMLAAGIMGSNASSMNWILKSGAAGVVSKSFSLNPHPGYVNPTTVGVEGGIINAIGLSNPGVANFKEELQKIERENNVVIASIYGATSDEFSKVVSEVQDYVDMIELNISCPHAMEGFGASIGQDCNLSHTIVSASKDATTDRKSTRLNSGHHRISYAVFCLKKKKSQYHQLYRLSRNCSKYRQQLYQYHEKYQPHQKQHQ